MFVVDFLLTILVLVLLFGFLVFVHELGHFLAAKIIGVEVEEFAFGFGKKLFARRYKDTLYRINLIPLGGYVKVLGDEDPSSFKQVEEEEFSDDEKSKYEKKIQELAGKDASILAKLYSVEENTELDPEGKAELLYYIKKSLIPNDPNFILKKSFFGKLFVYTAGVIMNILTAFVIFTVFLAVSGYETRLVKIANYPFIGVEVDEAKKPLVSNVYSDELIASGFDVDEENLGFILLEIDGQSMVEAEDFERIWEDIKGQKVWVKYQIYATGKEIEKELVLNSDGIDINIDPETKNKVVIASVNDGSPASRGGLKATDTILKVNGVDTKYSEPKDFLNFLEENAGNEVKFEILRKDGSFHNLKITLNEKDGDNLLLGASFQLNYIPSVVMYELDYSEIKPISGIAHTVNVFGYNPVAISKIVSISFEEKDPSIAGQSVRSIWGVGEDVNTLVVSRDYKNIINMAGLVSVSLAFMNILPIPLLDGGQIMFLVIEKVRGKALSAKMQERIANISFFFLIGLSVLVILKDIWLGFVGEFFRGIF